MGKPRKNGLCSISIEISREPEAKKTKFVLRNHTLEESNLVGLSKYKPDF